MKRSALLLLPLLLLGACASPKSHLQFGVGNGTQTLPQLPLQDVELRMDGKKVAEFEHIPPVKTGFSKPLKGSVPRQLELLWTDAKGQKHREVVETAAIVAPDFKGQLVLQVNEDQQVSVHPVEAPDGELSIIPWAVPEDWEGNLNFPGFEQE